MEEINAIIRRIKKIYDRICYKELNNESFIEEVEILKHLREIENSLYKKIKIEEMKQISLKLDNQNTSNILNVIGDDNLLSLKSRRIISKLYNEIDIEIKANPSDKLAAKTLTSYLKEESNIDTLIQNINAINYDFLVIFLNINECEKNKIFKEKVIKTKYDLIFSSPMLEEILIQTNFKINPIYLRSPIFFQYSDIEEYDHAALKYIFSEEIIDKQLSILLNPNNENEFNIFLRKNILKSAFQFQEIEDLEMLKDDLLESQTHKLNNKGLETAIEAIEYVKKIN